MKKPKLKRTIAPLLLSLVASLCMAAPAQAQQPALPSDIDTTFTDYDALFSEMDAFLDSLLKPRSFLVVNAGISKGYFNYATAQNNSSITLSRIVLSPTVSYYSRTGLGLSAGATMIREGRRINAFQYALSASYDYIKSRKFVTGVSYTRFITGDSLNFYTSPLQNTVYAYFTYRPWWVKPTIAVNYGWGSRSSYSERTSLLQALRLRKRGSTQINTEESVQDLTVTAAVRHDFYFLDVLSKKDFIRVTPQVSFTSGTQKFGFNQSANTYGTLRMTGTNILLNSQNTTLDDHLVFQPISLTGFLKTEYSFGKVYLQPQLTLDYYFPANSNNFTTTFQVNLGVIF